MLTTLLKPSYTCLSVTTDFKKKKKKNNLISYVSHLRSCSTVKQDFAHQTGKKKKSKKKLHDPSKYASMILLHLCFIPCEISSRFITNCSHIHSLGFPVYQRLTSDCPCACRYLEVETLKKNWKWLLVLIELVYTETNKQHPDT